MRARHAALFFIIIALACGVPMFVYASTIWSSATTHSDEVRVYTPDLANLWFSGTSASMAIRIGTWNHSDFTTTASTSAHMWARWNGSYLPTLDVVLRASAGGDPFYGSGSTTAQIIAQPSSFYFIGVDATSTLQEYTIQTNQNATINQGDELWAWIYTSWAGYGANHWLGSNGTMPYLEICEGDCDSNDPPPDLCATPGACASNVLFLPGIEGSRLYEGTGCGKSAEEKLWEPIGDSIIKILRGAGDDKVKNLFLDATGESACSDIYAKENDIIDSVGGGNIYKSFIDEMNGMKSGGTINDWKSVAYDWRLSLDDLLNKGSVHPEGAPSGGGKIYYEQSTSTPYILQTLRALAAGSKTGKVTIVAHSNGGLLAKALLNQLGGETAKSLVDKVIMVGSPQSGAPEGLGATLVGHDAGLYWGGFLPIVSNAVARSLALNSPMAYHLLPSANYLASIIDDPTHPVIHFSGDGYAKEKAAYGNSIVDISALDNFLLAKEGGRVQPDPSDTSSANILNLALIDYANTTHSTLDNWAPPVGVEVYQIAGWGVDTVAGIDFYTPQLADAISAVSAPRAYRPIFTEDGDGTVTVPSALMMASSTSVKRYWLNLAEYNRDTHSTYKHPNIFETSPLQGFIKNILENNTSTIPSYISTSQPPPNTSDKKLTFFLHSPLTLQLTDSSGNVTGLAPDDSMTEDIPGSTYGEFGDVKYITVPGGGNYQLTMHGQASGTFSLDIQETTGGDITASTTIANVPTTGNTLASLTITGGIDTASELTVDENGDGGNIITMTPALGQTVNYVPPATPSPSSGSATATAPASSSSGGGFIGSISIPLIATSTATTTVQLTSTSTTVAVISVPKVKDKIAIVVKKNTAPAKKVTQQILQTASVYSASQQPVPKKFGEMFYNGLYNFWTALKKFF